MVRGLFTRLERALAYFPELTLKGTPEHVGLEYEDLWLETDDGNRVHGWWIPGPARTPLQATSGQPTWVYFHGNGGNISARLDGYRSIHRFTGANILAIDYRGFGLSEGQPCEAGTYVDGLAAVAEARRRHGSSKGPLVLLGVSMGSAVASRLACDTSPDAVVLESPPSSFLDLAPVHYPWTRWLPLSLIMQYRYETKNHVARSNVPTLVVHGDEDDIVPLFSGQIVFDRANEPKQLHVVKGGTHDRPDLVDEARYYEVVNRFIDEFASPVHVQHDQSLAAD